MSATPTQLTLKMLRKEGWTCAIVEHWNPHVKIRQDLFGIVDVLAIRERETLAVQTTTKHNMNARIRKIADAEHIGAIRDAGWAIHVHGWEKVKNRWQVQIEDCS